jgi:hypothetical protein
MKKSILFGFLFFTFLACQNDEEEIIAIKKLLETESKTWRAGDYKAHAACWHIQPYSRVLVSTSTGQSFDIPADKIISPKAQMGNGGSAKNSNYKIHIDGKTAWVSHDEISTATDGQKTYSHEIRLLEKIDGSWKLVAQSIHQYQPKIK